MPRTLNAQTALDRHFLETRGKILEIAANLDRIAEGAGDAKSDRRYAQLAKALNILTSDRPDKAAACQMAFSLSFEDGWKAPNAK
ncbi:MAG: hypothetical protein H6819_11410 [Phycisphaerales bacterium]|nr:hypothetical protein [Phycisphaerales bacterium]MCB9855007.1 hypothetical protein [Phycisphaerales bacterium]MCB9863476.1 hypothetical protein [Phycisphaerales bacterium]